METTDEKAKAIEYAINVLITELVRILVKEEIDRVFANNEEGKGQINTDKIAKNVHAKVVDEIKRQDPFGKLRDEIR